MQENVDSEYVGQKLIEVLTNYPEDICSLALELLWAGGDNIAEIAGDLNVDKKVLEAVMNILRDEFSEEKSSTIH